MELNPDKKVTKHKNRWQLDYQNDKKARELLKDLRNFEREIDELHNNAKLYEIYKLYEKGQEKLKNEPNLSQNAQSHTTKPKISKKALKMTI